MSSPSPTGVVEHVSPLPFDLALERIDHAIMDHGMTIFARIDHAANARAAGLNMPPTTVLIYGKAEGGTPIMQVTPVAALDLPLRVLVRERADGVTVVAFHPIVDVLRNAGVAEDVAARLAPAQDTLVRALAS
jgi:uncharacterized protein (DUF302 family)